MTICSSCSSERGEQDRFCRSCGVRVATSVGDLVDTRRFNPDGSPNAALRPDSRELPPPFYVPPAAAYPVAQTGSMPYQTASLRKKLFRRKFVWLTLLWILSLVIVAGVSIGAREASYRRSRGGGSEAPRTNITEDVQNSLGLRPGRLSDAGYPAEVKGVYVDSLITDDGPAAVANVQAGDVLTELNEKPVRNLDDAGRILGSLMPSTEVPVKVYREGEILNLRIKVANRGFPPIQPNLESREQGWLGVNGSVRRCCLPGDQKWGVQIQGTNDNSPADLGGLRAGDMITEFNGFKVRTPGELDRRIRLTKPRSKLTVTFYRGNIEQKTELILGHR